MEILRTLNREKALLVALMVAIALVFARTLAGEFLAWDDIQHFRLNAPLHAGDYLRFWRAPYYGLYIPVTYSVWTALTKISAAPWILHAFNLTLHLLNTVFAYSIARARGLDRRALLVAAAFALHPLQVEAVAWISGGRDLLMAFFGLAAVMALDRRQTPLGFVLFLLGLLAQPALAPLPVALIVLDKDSPLKKGWVLTPWLLAGLAALAFTRWIQSPFTALRVPDVNPCARPWIALDTLAFYVRQFFFPYPLSADYARTPAVAMSSGNLWPLLGLLLLIFAYALARRPAYLPRMKAFLFSVTLLGPVLGLVPFEAQVQSR